MYTPQPTELVQLLLAAPEPLLMLGAPPVAVPMTAWDIAATWLSAAVLFVLDCWIFFLGVIAAIVTISFVTSLIIT